MSEHETNEEFKASELENHLHKEISNKSSKVTIADFEILGPLGKGSYGEVSMVKRIDTDNFYALKAIDKHFLFKVQSN